MLGKQMFANTMSMDDTALHAVFWSFELCSDAENRMIYCSAIQSFSCPSRLAPSRTALVSNASLGFVTAYSREAAELMFCLGRLSSWCWGTAWLLARCLASIIVGWIPQQRVRTSCFPPTAPKSSVLSFPDAGLPFVWCSVAYAVRSTAHNRLTEAALQILLPIALMYDRTYNFSFFPRHPGVGSRKPLQRRMFK